MLIINISCGSKHLLFWVGLIFLAKAASCLAFAFSVCFVSTSR